MDVDADNGVLISCFEFICPLRQYFSLYRAVPKVERTEITTLSTQPPPVHNASTAGSCPTLNL